MLKSLELENFKAFGQRTRIELAPITLIFGENSSGKSSILQSLNLLKQTRESRELGAPLLPRAEDGISDLGSFQELLFDHDIERSLRIAVEITVDPRRRPGFFRRYFPSKQLSSLALALCFRRNKKDGEVEVAGFDLRSASQAETLARFKAKDLSTDERRAALPYWGPVRSRFSRAQGKLRGARCVDITKEESLWRSIHEEWLKRKDEICESLRQAADPERYEQLELPLEVDDSKSERREKQLQSLKAAVDFYSTNFGLGEFIDRMARGSIETPVGLEGFLPIPMRHSGFGVLPELRVLGPERRRSPLPILDVASLAGVAGRLLEEALVSLFPMGPYRRPPERWYIFTGTSPDDVGYRGDLLPDLLYRRSELVEEANEWLRRLKIGYQLRVRPIGERAKDLFEVRLADTKRKVEVDVALSDVGFGVSQILPFVVQSLAAANQIISIEQPEVHIHPRLQADLGDLIAATVKEPQGHQFLIETHSEHLVLRIQKLVRERKLSPEDVSVIYVSRGPNGSNATRLHLDEEGSFVDEWPGGFFPERRRELL